MYNGSRDDVDRAAHFLPKTSNHPVSSTLHSGFRPLNGASIGPSLAALPFSAEAAFPYIVCNISYFLLSCKIRLLHIGWKKKKVVNFCTTFKMNLQIMKKWVSPIRTHPWRKRWDSNPRALADNLISSLLCNCDGGARFGVVSVSPVPAESRLKSGFFARKALRDGFF